MKIETKKKLINFGAKYFKFFIKLWYAITQRFTIFKGHPVEAVENVNLIAERLEFGTLWKSDPRIDIMYHPSKTQRWVDLHAFKHFDCEDHSAYSSAVLLKSNLVKKIWIAVYYMEFRKQITGHSFYVYEDFDGTYHWADYSFPKKTNSLWDSVYENAKEFHSKPFGAVMIEVKDISDNDTLEFGKTLFKKFD